jgi:starvation-inducible DNA-binding protein
MSMISDDLQKILANTYALYLKTQNYHWNVEGIHFHMLHVFFEDQYKKLESAIDEIAEQIRMQGVKVIANFSEFDRIKTIEDSQNNISAKEMIDDLIVSHEAVLKSINDAISATKSGDVAVLELLTKRNTEHSKMLWILKSHT